MKFITSGGCFDGEYLWLPFFQYNGLFCVRINENCKLQYIGKFQNNYPKENLIISKSFSFGKYIYFFPDSRYEVWIYNKSQKNIEHQVIYKSEQTEIFVIKVGRDAWIIPRVFKHPIIKYNLNTRQIQRIEWNKKEWSGLDSGMTTELCLCKNKIFLATKKINNIMLICIDTTEFGINGYLLDIFEAVSSVFVMGERIGVYGKSKKRENIICEYDIDGRLCHVHKMNEISIHENGADTPYKCIAYDQNHILFLPYHEKNIYLYTIKTGEIKLIKYPEHFEKMLRNDPMVRISTYVMHDNHLIFFPETVPCMLNFDINSSSLGMIEFGEFQMGSSIYEILNKEICDCIHKENYGLGLHDFLRILDYIK